MRPAALAACLAMLAPAAAQAVEVSTPDGRARLRVEGGSADGSGFLQADGDLGAFGFDHRIDGGGDHVRFSNPPMARAWEVSPGGFRIERDELYGPRIANAAIGSGALTAGFDARGRLTGLGWPGPGLYDHVNFVTVTREAPNQGAPANAGSFGGTPAGWLLPAFGWQTVSQSYAAEDAETVETVLEHATGARVTITDVVDPERDLLARNFRFTEPPAGGLAYYANMNPTTARAPRVPSVTDGALDDLSDFATVYDPQASALLHFRPYKVDPASLTAAATGQPGVATALRAASGAFGPGVYVAVAGQARAAGFQAGLDGFGLLRAEAEGTPAADPYYDLTTDGSLSGSFAAFGKTAGGLAGLAPDADGSYTVYVSAGADAATALGIVDEARAEGFAAIRAASEASWRAWIGRARLPATADARTLAVARRALMAIRTAQDRRTGAILAAVTTQTPYRQDWVRDGAFFNYALLLAGYPEMAIRHADFYRGVYRPGGTWDSFYYPDGAEAGAVFPYEIDSQGFALWALWLPYAMDAAGTEYLRRVWPAIRETADALLLCTDPVNRMQCRAPEDDAVAPTQGAQGAAIVYLALRSAADAARALGLDPGPRWTERAAELRATALARLCGGGGCPGGRGGIYLVWPSRLLDPEDPARAALAQAHLGRYASELDAWAAFAEPAPGGFLQYPMEPLLALAPFWDDPGRDERLDRWVRWLTHDVPEPGVLHYGERIFHTGGAYLHTIGFPHIWSGTEMYLAAAFAHGVTGCPPGAARLGEATCR